MRKGDSLKVLRGGESNLQDSLFGQRWVCAIFDEAHSLRTDGLLGRGALALRQRSRFTVLATATPLFNGERVSRSMTSLPVFETDRLLLK